VVALAFTLEKKPMQLSLLKEGDWAGIVTMAIGLGSLQTVLEEGNKDDWFGSPFIVRLAIIAAASLSLFIWIEFTSRKPLLNLRLLFRRNFGLGTLSNVMLGAALYGSSFILPLYLSQIQGYNAEQIGEVLAWTGLPQLLLIPLVPRLMRLFDIRLLVALGLAFFAASNFMNIYMSADVAGDQLLVPNIVRALGQAVVIAPLAALATAGIERENAASASSLFNMMRNLGGAIGIAVLQTFVTKREQFHSNILSDSVSVFDDATRARLAQLTHYFLTHGIADPAQAWREAVVAVGRDVRQQAFLMGYGDTFFLLGIVLTVAVVAVLLLRKADRPAAGAAH